MPNCPKCGTESTEGTKFCPECGQSLTQPQSEAAPIPEPQAAVPAQPTEESKKKLPRWLLFAAGGILLFLFLCCAILALTPRSESSKATSTARAVARATQSAVPLSTPVSTATFTPKPKPTNTREPTSTPTVTNTPKPTNTSAPTDTPIPTATPEPTNTLEPLQSGGLGLSKTAWDTMHGEGKKTDLGYTAYADGMYEILFAGERAQHIEIMLPDVGFNLEVAQSLARALLPLDAVLVEKYILDEAPEITVELYNSEWLKDRFDDDWWFGSKPGDHIIIYGIFDNAVKQLIVATGNNP